MVLCSDHGESWTADEPYHGRSLRNSVLRVPAGKTMTVLELTTMEWAAPGIVGRLARPGATAPPDAL